MRRHSEPSHHHAASEVLEVPLPQPFAGLVPYVEYGDTRGELGHRHVAGGQSLPAGFADFYNSIGSNPTQIALTVFGDADVLRGRASGGDDTISVFASVEVLVGDARLMLDAARGGDDSLAASGSLAAIFGDAEVMRDHAQGGDDVMRGGSGSGARSSAVNTLYGDAYAMSGWSLGGDDLIRGGGSYPGSRNTIYGDAHSLSGHAQAGNDTLTGGNYAKNDLWGDAAEIEGTCVVTGHDVFVVTPSSGTNTIHDFEPGRDVIDLTAFASGSSNIPAIHGLDDLLRYLEVTEAGSTFFFGRFGTEGPGPVIESGFTVLGDQALTACDFLFA